jgi:hypothetical protein
LSSRCLISKKNLQGYDEPINPNLHFGTGGPRYSRSFYLRFRLFAIKESIPKFGIRGLSLAYSGFLIVLDTKSSFKKAFWDHTVIPHYSRFQNSRCFDRTYLLRITRETCISYRQKLPFHSLLTCFNCTGDPRYMRSFYLRIRVSGTGN